MKNSIKKLVVGTGNLLLSDEGIGIHIVRELQRLHDSDEKLFQDTAFIDIGTSSFDILSHINTEIEKVVLIDCIKADGFVPGTVFKLTPDDLRKKQKEKYSLHQMELVDTLKMVSIIEKMPDVIILGIVPDEINKFSVKLSGEITDKFQSIVNKIKKEIIEFFND